MSRSTLTRALLAVIVVGYVVIAGAYAIYVPDWQTPDEPAHYNYIAQIAADGHLPTIDMGDWDQAYLDDLRGNRFDPALLGDLDAVQYEDHQPPLYYALAAPIYALTDGSLTALRLFSVAWGVVIVLCAFGVGAAMFPARPWIGLGAAAFVAFLPQHVHILASVNNDSLAWAIVAVTLYATTRYLLVTETRVRPWMLGLLVGLGFVTKATTYLLAGVVPLALLLRWWLGTPADQRRDRIGVLLRAGAQFAVPALVFGLLWWGRNIAVYDFPDFLGLAAHDAVVVGQPRTAALIERIGWGGYLREIGTVTLNSFIGRFGWMGVPMAGWSYYVVLVLIGGGLLGLLVDAFTRTPDDTPHTRRRWTVWVVLYATMGLVMLAYLYYNTEFQQHQGRYMYPLLIPLGVLLALGVDAWRRLLLRPLGREETAWLTALVFLGLAPLCGWLLLRVIVPNLEFV
jgi:4-amino-4-deoxy-L-arabinose transferase-like glycosyltransferase